MRAHRAGVAGGIAGTVAAGLVVLGFAAPVAKEPRGSKLELVPYFSEDFGMQTVAPSGWQEVEAGAFRCDLYPSARFTLGFFPGMKREWLEWWIEGISPGIKGLPAVTGELVSESLHWILHQGQAELPEGGRLSVDLAVAQTEDGIFVIVLTAGLNDVQRLRSELFMPAVTTLAPEAEPKPAGASDDIGHLFDYSQESLLDIQTQGSIHRDAFEEVTLSYSSPRGGRVPATLMIPNGMGPFPGLILMHGQSLSREHWFPWGRLYAESGAVVLLIDGPQHRPEPRSLPVVTFTPKDREGQIQLIQDLRRGVDLLVERSDVDRNRLAYVGYSYGGSMGGLLAGVEKRLVASVLMVGDGGLVEHLTGVDDRQETDMFFALPAEKQHAWREAMEPLEPLQFIGRAESTSLLFQSALLDQMVRYPDAVRYQRAARQPKTILWYRSGHMLPAQAWKDQAGWLQGHLGIDASVFP